MAEAQFLHPLTVGADRARVGADLRLGEDDADPHVGLLSKINSPDVIPPFRAPTAVLHERMTFPYKTTVGGAF
ncbi:hypothetical protein HerbRD11066_58220 [Herbidospora sp. RD11066]